jgi:outer membrane cobalamin receptor
MLKRHYWLGLAAWMGVAAHGVGGPAFAQTEETGAADEEIVVTGSRLARARNEGSSPLVILDREELRLTGAVTLEALLTTQPQFTGGQTARSNNPGTGAAQIDLRGLGASRNLVLVNGRRYVFFSES